MPTQSKNRASFAFGDGASDDVPTETAPTAQDPEDYDIDFSGVEERQLIPAGKYTVQVEKANASWNPKGNKQIALSMRIIEGDYEGQRVYDYIYLTAAAASIAYEKLGAIRGAALPKGPFTADVDFCDSLEGRVVQAVTKIDTYEGTDRVKVQYYKPFRGAEATPTKTGRGKPELSL